MWELSVYRELGENNQKLLDQVRRRRDVLANLMAEDQK